MGKRINENSINPNNTNAKRVKLRDNSNEENVKPKKCTICDQYIDNITFYNGHPNKSSEELIALTDEKLSLFSGTEDISEGDGLPLHKITNFNVYDNKGHLCSFDTGLVEKNVLLYLSGYLKPIYEEDTSLYNGIPVHDVGPINEWYISGFDGGERALVGITTPYAQYFLMDPSEEYKPFIKLLMQKVALLKLVIEFLLDHSWEDPSYEDLLFQIESVGNIEFNEDFLLQHAQFICDQVYSFDQAGGDNDDDDDNLLITTPCIRTLVNLAGVTFHKRKKIRQLESNKQIKKKKAFTKAVTTPLVSSVFENFFPDEIVIKDKGPKKKRCGVCDACQSPDCGKCAHCKDMVKFGGTGRAKQACKLRKCPNMAVEDAELSENENEEDEINEEKQKKKICFKRKVNDVEWSDKPIFESKGKQFYDSAIVGEIKIKVGDYVMLHPENPDVALYIGRIEYMYERFPQGPTVHIEMFWRGSDTILGETADPQELFVVNLCEDCPLGSIVRKAEVIFKETLENWSELGGTETLAPSSDDGDVFHIFKRYDCQTARFTDYIKKERPEKVDYCNCCWIKRQENSINTPILEENEIKWRNDVYRIGSAVFLDPSVYKFTFYRTSDDDDNNDDAKNVDEKIYTEYYRKTAEVKGSNLNTPEPFCVAQIEGIYQKAKDIKLDVRIFYRPENTKTGVFLAYQKDVNLLYWTNEIITTSFDKVSGKCYLLYCDISESPEEWCSKGPYRFYYREAYNTDSFEFSQVPEYARKIGSLGKGKGKGKSKSAKVIKRVETAPLWDQIDRPLRCMDVFAGCGGLSKGLHQAGIAETKWAIEIETSAAQAFKLNNRDCKVFSTDCNEIFEEILSGKGSVKGLPTKGEVEMLVGGPPCQGFSGMNRFNKGEYSSFKNSLVVSFLSYCDYFRPKYFVLENVRNFVTFKRSIVLKLTLRCLLAIGYQVTFGVLQAGHYGIPQTRRRLILIAAAPGYVLPKLPEPQHVFNKSGCHLSFALDGVRYTNGHLWTKSAPYRTICVRDAISDLPEIQNGWNETEMLYDADAISHFQRKMRRNDSNKVVVDHICKKLSPLVEARIAHIPETPGSDWRNLPNICVKLSDGTMTSKLNYTYGKKKQKKGEPNRGVCRCAIGETCTAADRQINTLIPWCLPHTADRHNHWAGLYGRLEWDGFFGTTITNPEPMGKQGRVLHPEENRVVSVRECARSQGFPDHFKFFGNILDKHRQVGNAVPPPLGEAIGVEIKKALFVTNLNKLDQ